MDSLKWDATLIDVQTDGGWHSSAQRSELNRSHTRRANILRHAQRNAPVRYTHLNAFLYQHARSRLYICGTRTHA